VSLSYGDGHEVRTYVAWYVISGALLTTALLSWLWASRRSWIETSSEPSRQTTDQAVARLRKYASKRSAAKILVFPPSQVPLAREISSVFQLAGWSTNLIEEPQERHVGRYVEGVEVRGVNRHLVEVVARALSDFGVPGISTTVKRNTIEKENPEHPSLWSRFGVTVGNVAAG
jgi:hypothetical protein